MQKTITNSANISVLEAKIISDLCLGNFVIDLSPTVWIGSGASNVQGVKISIENPFDVAVKPFASIGFDIVPPMSGVVTFPVPTTNGNFQYGRYIVNVELTDTDGTIYTISDEFSICEPNPKDKTKKWGNINAEIKGICKENKAVIRLDEPPVYKGKVYETKTQTLELQYPTGSGLSPLSNSANSFTVLLFEGVYLLTGDVCATYNLGSNIFVKVPYKVKCKKNILCLVDLCCVYDRLDQLNQDLISCLKEGEKTQITDTIIDALRLLKTIDLGSSCGEDVSDYISELETLLGCKCTCSASEGTPISNSTPAADIVINGCNVVPQTVGLTTIYTIDNYEYIVTVNPASNSIIAFSASTLNACVKSQQLTFNVQGAYSAIKQLVNNTNEYNFWADTVKKSYIPSVDTLACLGITSIAYQAMTYAQFQEAVISKMCSCCSGSKCDARIGAEILTPQGSKELFQWTNITGVFSVEVYIDGQLADTVLAPVNSYLAVLAGAMTNHSYRLIAKCSNGAQGNILQGTFTNTGCAIIPAPSLSSINVVGAVCPYNLTSLTPAAGAGYSLEWHNQNNRNLLSLVSNPASVTSGDYYAFLVEDATQCSSPSSKVTVTCAVAGNCTEPLFPNVVEVAGGNALITFNSASTPPPGYLVKRRLFSNPDVDGSYTTIGAPAFNSGTSQWAITDTTLASNVLYGYKIESQCADSSRPSAYFTFAKISCPTVAYTPTENTIGYSFNGVGGSVDKYEVKIYNNTGSILIDTDSYTPAFASPITGTFTALSQETNYKIGVRVYLGTYFKDCMLTLVVTTAGATGSPLFVGLSRSGTNTGNLTLAMDGGTPPYSYTFIGNGTGACEAHTIDVPNGTSPDGIGIISGYTTIPYSGTTYQFYAIVTDSIGTVATSNISSIAACLVPSTLIRLKDGKEQPLSELEIGTELFGEDNKIEAYTRLTTDLLYVINGGLLQCSEGHLHPLADGRLLQTSALKVGDKYKAINGGMVEIYTIEKKHGNFEVIDISTTNKTYFANSVLTHNKTACP